jgi:hypothetical protein
MVSLQGWHPDPSGRNRFRYFDGYQWTAYVNNGEPHGILEGNVPYVLAPARVPNAVAARGALLLLIGGAGLVLLGAMLPWFHFTYFVGGGTNAGGDSAAVLTGLGAVVGGIGAGVALVNPKAIVSAGAVGFGSAAIVLLFSVFNLWDALDHDNGLGGVISVSPAVGLWLTVIGGAVLGLAAASVLRSQR